MIIYNLEKFCIEHIIRPFLSTLDERTWLVEFKKDILTQEQIEEWSKLKKRYEQSVYRVDGLSRWVNELEMNKDWAELVFKRLKSLDIKFYKHLDKKNVFLEYVKRKLEEQ